MKHRELLERLVVDVFRVQTELLEVDGLGGPTVELPDVRAVRASHDRRRAAHDAAVRDPHADRGTAPDRHRDHAVRQRAAVGEPCTHHASGRSAGEGNFSAGDSIRTCDELGLVTGFRIDEEEHGAMPSAVDRSERFGRRVATGLARVSALDRADRGGERRREGDRRATGLEQAIRAHHARPRHAGNVRVTGGGLGFTRGGFGIDVAGREDQDEAGFSPERPHGVFDGLRACVAPERRRRARNALVDVGSGCRRHCRGRQPGQRHWFRPRRSRPKRNVSASDGVVPT
jgi:hypothetical protein